MRKEGANFKVQVRFEELKRSQEKDTFQTSALYRNGNFIRCRRQSSGAFYRNSGVKHLLIFFTMEHHRNQRKSLSN